MEEQQNKKKKEEQQRKKEEEEQLRKKVEEKQQRSNHVLDNFDAFFLNMPNAGILTAPDRNDGKWTLSHMSDGMHKPTKLKITLQNLLKHKLTGKIFAPQKKDQSYRVQTVNELDNYHEVSIPIYSQTMNSPVEKKKEKVPEFKEPKIKYF